MIRSARILLATACLTLLAGGLLPAAVQAAPPGRLIALPMAQAAPHPEFDQDTVLVKFHTGVKGADQARALSAAGVRAGAAVGRTGYTVVDTQGQRPTSVEHDLEADPSVAQVQLNYLRHAEKAPDDEFYAAYQKKYLSTAKFPSAWDITIGSTSKSIAIVDTGVDTGHEDLSGARIKAGWDFVNNDANPSDDNGHGTMVAGIAAAITDNGTGVAGAAWKAGIIPVKVLDADGVGTDANVAAGIEWAADHGAKVINLSLGGYGTDPVLEDAVAYAVSKDVVVVAAAGNESTDLPSYPASYPDVLSVAATDKSGTFASFSDWGWTVDLAAPGMGITSTYPESLTPPGYIPYASGDGTSFAAPLVSAAALLVRVQNASWTQAQVADRLRSTAHDKGPTGIDRFYGWGVLDANAALGGTKQSPATQPVQDSLESDGVIDRANDLTSSGSTSTPTISPEGDTDWFAFTAPAPGTVTWTVTPPAADPEGDRAREMDPVLEAYGPAFDLLGTMDATFQGEAETLAVPADTEGTYYLKVSNFDGSRSPGAYEVEVSASGTPLPPAPGPGVWVRTAIPRDFSTTASRSVSPSVTFGRDLDPTSITSDTVFMKNGKTWTNPTVTLSYDAATRKLTLERSKDLAKSTPFVVFVDGVTDTDGNPMPAFSFSFVTKAS